MRIPIFRVGSWARWRIVQRRWDVDCVDLVSWCQMFHRKHRKTIGKQCGMMIFTGLHGDFNDHHFRRFHGTIYKDIYTYSSFLGGSKGASQFDLGSREFYICQTNTSEIEQNSRHFPKFEKQRQILPHFPNHQRSYQRSSEIQVTTNLWKLNHQKSSEVRKNSLLPSLLVPLRL